MKSFVVAAVFVLFAAEASMMQTMPEWMAGSWTSQHDGVRMEEHWSLGNGGLMVGMHRDVTANGTTSFEFLRIERRGGTLVYLAMPHVRPETPFPLKSMTSSRVVFENPDHDFSRSASLTGATAPGSAREPREASSRSRSPRSGAGTGWLAQCSKREAADA